MTNMSAKSVYTGKTNSWPMVVATSLGAIALVWTSLATDPLPTAAAAVCLLAAIGIAAEVLTGSSVRATAGPAGLTVRWGIFGWPRSVYALADIASVEVVDIPWWRVSYGFWWTPRRTTSTVRSGETLQIRTRSGRLVTVTVPRPREAAEALTAVDGPGAGLEAEP